MSKTFITCVSATAGGLTDALCRKVMEAIRQLAAERVDTEILSPGRAGDFILHAQHPALTVKLRAAFQDIEGCDVFVQPDDGCRRKKLLIADMDATMIVGETLDDIAAHLGIKDRIAPITAAAMRGEIDFKEALDRRVALLKGVHADVLHEVLARTVFSTGGEKLVKTMAGQGARCVLVSGGFDLFTRHVASSLGFHRDVGNRLEIVNDHLTGRVLPPVVDKEAKRKLLLDTCREMNIRPEESLAVGDGANDIPLLLAAGVGAGHHPKPAVAAAVPYHIRHTDLSSLLFLQGYTA